MFRKAWAGVGVVLLTVVFLASGGCHFKATGAGSQAIKLKVLLPDERAIVLIDGKEFQGTGAERTITAATGAGKDYVNVLVSWEPNGYTKITRPRKVAWKAEEIEVDLRKASDTEKDDIVVKFVATPENVVDAMCKLAKIGKDDIVYDLGCGDGRMVLTAVQKFGAKKGVGVDLDPELVKQCQKSAKDAGVSDKLHYRVGDVLKVEDLSDASVVLLYMGDFINERLKPILQKTLKPGSRVVSHRFKMGDDWPPDRTETLRVDTWDYDIHLWEIKGEKK